MADDSGSDPAPRPKRRRRSTAKAGQEATPVAPIDIPTDDPAAAELDVNAPATAFAVDPNIDDTPLPTFLRPDRNAEAVTAESREAAARILDGWAEGREPTPATGPTPSPTDHGWLPLLDDRSPDPDICPFLRAVDDGDRMVAPVEVPDPANRCAALRDAVPQSLRQQELVCLASGHVNCPRYLRGAVVIAEAPEPVVRAGRTLTPAVFGSLIILVLAASASVAFVLSGGGLNMAVAPTASPGPSATEVAVAPPTPTPTIAPTPTPTPVPTPTPTASPSPSPSPTPSPTPAPTPTPTPEPTARPAPTSDRYALLRACPDTPRCWIYRVRSGDNLYSIANYFGVSQDSIYQRNPWTRTQGLRAGQELRLPPPTR